jgi:cytochrome c biogenesis protein CcdA
MLLFILSTSLVDGLTTTPQILILFFILTTVRPERRAWAYIAGVSVFYFLAGLAATLPAVRARDLFRLLNGAVAGGPDGVYYAVQAAVGFGLLAGGFAYYFRKPKELDREGRVARLLAGSGVMRAFLIGAAVTLGGLPGSVAYFAALDRLLTAGLTWPAQAAYILVYNVVYVLPLVVPLTLYLLLHRRIEDFAARLKLQVVRWNRVFLAVVLLVFGLTLLADSSFYFFAGKPIFSNRLL